MTTTKFHLSLASTNVKTGPIPVSTTTEDSCPSTCPLKAKGCYAKSGPLRSHWLRVGNKYGISAEEFLNQIKDLPKGQLWRHNQAGDLPHKKGKINESFLLSLAGANARKRGFTYTHHLPTKENISAIKKAIKLGFTINLSANNPDHAVELSKHGIPVVCIVPSDTKEKHFEKDGKKFLVCPATYRDKMTCAKCGLCQVADRKHIVAFPSHGTTKKTVDEISKNF